MSTRTVNIERIAAAVEWGLDDTRAAWTRALALAAREADRYPASELAAAKAGLKEEAKTWVESWYDSVLAATDFAAGQVGLKEKPEALWNDLVCMNGGIFLQGPDPLEGFLITVPSLKRDDAPLLLGPKVDGWGV